MEPESDNFTIDFKVLWQILKKEKWSILGIIILFNLAGTLYAYSLKEEFVSEGKILPESQGKASSLGQYAGLAALAGVDIGGATSGSDAVRPELYPDVLKSTPFFLELFKVKFKDKNNKVNSFQQYYTKEVLDGKLNPKDQKLQFPKSDNYIVFNRQTEKNIKDLKTRIIGSYDKKSGVISISVKLPDPVMAANVAKYTMDYLTSYIINYRTEKQKQDLNFIAKRLDAARGKYFNSQTKKATYSDQVPLSSLRLQSADLQRERIESEYKISSTFYNTLLQKYEEAKLKMQQETPVIKILEPPVVPNLKSEPKKSIILIICFIGSLFLSIVFALLISKNYKLILS
ncbi:Wzz/FepE/Etk N-terminal domain-containing protein [Lacihabitans soyangensis]|uniref:Lipopolysaccharide biosynthesis protein n=1 Tax=Lacihabitans soyangensis TaxID=869394 RepID=A0AAE3H2Q2_9BACT|nr:Wzz/FepE/Etk N-terminal domain-containing protein [Lacihabitans soyangensis]MCP9762899.1 lipopolysaccharide biosynthesis protein [Lacihabitans soyangensis]